MPICHWQQHSGQKLWAPQHSFSTISLAKQLGIVYHGNVAWKTSLGWHSPETVSIWVDCDLVSDVGPLNNMQFDLSPNLLFTTKFPRPNSFDEPPSALRLWSFQSLNGKSTSSFYIHSRKFYLTALLSSRHRLFKFLHLTRRSLTVYQYPFYSCCLLCIWNRN